MNDQIIYIHTPATHNTRAAKAFLPILFEEIKLPQSVVDVGCGTGTWLSVFKEMGIKRVLGIDGNNVDLAQLHIDRNEFKAVNLTQPVKLNERFDLAVCLEVAEHLPEASAEVLVSTLCDLSDQILFSAALPDQGGQNHLNEQFIDYWVNKFNQRGYICRDLFRAKIWNDSQIDCWYRQNMFFFERIQENPIVQEKINAYYHPEIYAFKHSQYSKTLGAKQKLINGEISVLSSLKILVKSIFFNLKKLVNN
ncbi:class I SAM-dependent methyltransferase [Salmonirosea aquatica]|uniref:Methyltransferase domain-containing protein n=1 Tax=Salmonirosea aquatica TaxID=2654236 RepID=A0A7C9BFY0_9BACT|nr:methyltransferase domain-containing protein [Cytophagaceae bacterium SJW1-29]